MKLVVVMKYSFVPQNSNGVITARMDTKLIIMKTEIGVRCNTGSNISKEQRVIFTRAGLGMESTLSTRIYQTHVLSPVSPQWHYVPSQQPGGVLSCLSCPGRGWSLQHY